MAVRKLKDDKGREYDVEVPDDEDEREESSGDEEEDTIYLDEEDIEWLRRKRREEAEASRTSQTKTTKQSGTSGKVVKIRGKSAPQSTGSKSQTSRKRTLRLA